MLIQGNRVARWACCSAALVCALAFTLVGSPTAVADETESDATIVADGADSSHVVDALQADDQHVAEQPETESAEDHAGATDGEGQAEGDPADAHGGHGADTHQEDGAHHNPYDLSHANATPMLEDPTEWRYDMALCTFAVFMILLMLLRTFAWRPMMAGLERRESAIATRIQEAERDAAEAATQLQAYRDKLAAAAQESQEIVTQARRDAEAVGDKVRNAAAEDAVRERQRALADIESAKKVALHEIAEKGADMAVGLAGRIVRRELNSQDHAELIRETLGQFPSNN